MYTTGQHVIIPYAAAPDVCGLAQSLLPMRGVVKGYGPIVQHDAPPGECVIAVEMPTEFPGGHTCNGLCLPRRGQYVAGKHLQLAEYTTVPQVQEIYETRPR